MKKAQFIGVSLVLGLGVLFSSCESLKKMAKNHAQVQYQVNPSPLEMHGDKVKVEISGTVPPKYFWNKFGESHSRLRGKIVPIPYLLCLI